VHTLIRSFFEIISDLNFKRDNELIYYVLCHLDGILEDSRARVKYFLEIMNDFKAKMDLVGILIKFISNSQEVYHRDIASHILVLLIDAEKYEKIEDDAKHFMTTLMIQKEMGFEGRDKPLVSLNALSFALMTMSKTNQLAREFSNANGFKILNQFLDQ
jgi:hypothetical protein